MAKEIGNPELINIDPEFESLIPKLRDEEFEGLRQSLLKDGCIDPLRVWDNAGKLVLLDGHNRYKICTNSTPRIQFETETVDIIDREDAKRWILDNQLGRRNLTDKQYAYIIGQRLELEKKPVGKPASDKLHQNDGIKGGETAAKIAKQTGVSQATVERDAKLAKDIDKIKKDAPNLANDILTEAVKATSQEIKTLAQKSPEEIKEIEQKVIGGSPLKEVLKEEAKTTKTRKTKTEEEVEQHVQLTFDYAVVWMDATVETLLERFSIDQVFSIFTSAMQKRGHLWTTSSAPEPVKALEPAKPDQEKDTEDAVSTGRVSASSTAEDLVAASLVKSKTSKAPSEKALAKQKEVDEIKRQIQKYWDAGHKTPTEIKKAIGNISGRMVSDYLAEMGLRQKNA